MQIIMSLMILKNSFEGKLIESLYTSVWGCEISCNKGGCIGNVEFENTEFEKCNDSQEEQDVLAVLISKAEQERRQILKNSKVLIHMMKYLMLDKLSLVLLG